MAVMIAAATVTIPAFLFFLENVFSWLSYFWWVWLFIIAWWYYKWASDHLAFSPLLTIVVAAILIYFLVIEHPLIGSAGVVLWVILSSSIFYVLALVPSFTGFFKK